MRMKKIGILAMALVLVLGLTGAGFAHWSDQLRINGVIETGEVLIGFVDQYTDDPLLTVDPVNVDQIPVCAPSPPLDKDVADTTCVLQLPREHCDETPAEHLGVVQYEKIHIDMDNVYPGYAPSVYFDIANCGSIPVVITGARVIKTSVNGTEFVVDIELPKCTPIQIDLDQDGDDDVAIGFSMDPAEPDQQIDPCETIKYDLHFMFKDGTDPITGEPFGLDECTDYDFEIKIDAVQWNKA